VGSPVASVGPGVGVEVGAAVGVFGGRRDRHRLEPDRATREKARHEPYRRGLIRGRGGGSGGRLARRRLFAVQTYQWVVILEPSLLQWSLTAVGSSVGAAVGEAVGSSVGDAVGSSVGVAVGVAVGSSVGAGVGNCQPRISPR
jgi:hypothetical protein